MLLTCYNLQAKKIEGVITLHSGETIDAIISGFRKGHISPYTKIKSETKTIDLSTISLISIPTENLTFEVFGVTLFEDVQYIISTKVNDRLYFGLVRYRPCACNESYRIGKAYVYLENNQKSVLIKHHLRDKVLKKNGVYHGVSKSLEKLLVPASYRFSIIPELIPQ